MAKKKKEPKQQTLEATMGRSRVRRTIVTERKKPSSRVVQRSSPRNHNAPAAGPPSSAPTAFSFMQGRSSPVEPSPRRKAVVLDSSSSESEAEPAPKDKKKKDKKDKKDKTRTKAKTKKVVSDDDDDDDEEEDDDDVVLPSSSAANRRRRSPAKKRVVSSESEAEPEKHEDEEEDEEEEELPSLPPPKKILGKRSRVKREDSSDDDLVLTSPRKKSKSITVRATDETSESDDDKPLTTPVSVNRPKRNIVLDDSDEEDEPQPLSSPTKRKRLIRRGEPLGSIKEDEEEQEQAPRPSQAATRRKPRTEKEKARELLRRKRAGENINEEDLEEEEDEEEEEPPKKALYDSDSDMVALQEFEDDDEGVLDPAQVAAANKEKKRRKKQEKKKQISSDSDSDSDDSNADGSDGEDGEEGSEDDWLVDDGEIGVPDDIMAQIPLQFTSHSHKPLKKHFHDVVEWCVHTKVNPGFSEKHHELYRLGWQKLDDEVRALAQSKFASSAWKSDFYMALRARPYFTNEEVGGQENMFGLENCAACGRSGHPAKWRMSFSGSPYYKSFNSQAFLEPVESKGGSSSSSSSDEDEESDSSNNEAKEEVDEDGNTIPPASKTWLIGSVCNSNAETAHSLLHWKFSLLDWVDANLEKDGYMTAEKLKERSKWKPKKKYKLAKKILERWDQGAVGRLWKEFKETIEAARNKSTTGRYQR